MPIVIESVGDQNTFNVQRHLISRRTLRVVRDEAFQTWRAATAA
jgi:hypothetical protein